MGDVIGYPFVASVGEALRRDVDDVRPNVAHAEDFIRLQVPRIPIFATAIYTIVSQRLRALDIQAAHIGPHALRHSCAAKMLADGLTLKEIGDHLGHRSTSATMTYTKVDLASSRQMLVLYGAGLRISEALGLTLADVNIAERVLTVRNTKFYKTRLVPIGPQLAATLTTYYDKHSRLSMPKGHDSAFLCSRSGCRLTYQYVVTLFQRVRSAAGIARPPGEPGPPRLHDLRHTAAVHRALAWYRSGKDVHQLLPHLATYLGHACIASTQRYPQTTPELLQEASCRFAAYAQHEVAQEVDHA